METERNIFLDLLVLTLMVGMCLWAAKACFETPAPPATPTGITIQQVRP